MKMDEWPPTHQPRLVPQETRNLLFQFQKCCVNWATAWKVPFRSRFVPSWLLRPPSRGPINDLIHRQQSTEAEETRNAGASTVRSGCRCAGEDVREALADPGIGAPLAYGANDFLQLVTPGRVTHAGDDQNIIG
jgi:hypothetical protein